MNHPLAGIDETDERAIDQTLAQWVLKRTGSNLLAAAVHAASAAEGLGHSCAWLVDPKTGAGFDEDALGALRQHEWVGDGSRFTPLVLDAQGRFYMWRNWQHESKLAAAILQRCSRRTLPVPIDRLAADIESLFANSPSDSSHWQRVAVAMAPGSRFFVLTGGPGTGKTTTVVRMLLLMLRHAEACGLPSQPSIALAAPTGKAAQRLVQAIARGKTELQQLLADGGDTTLGPELLSLIPHADARTLHRLLGYRPMDNTFGRGAGNPLAEDIVVVDEASMVDLAMMRQLLESLRPDATLILLGDPGQLASVDAGSVLSDIVASAPTNRFSSDTIRALSPQLVAPDSETSDAPLADHIVTLTHAWRADSGLQRGIQALRGSVDGAWLDALLTNRSDGELHVRRCVDGNDLRTQADAWIERHASSLQAVLTPGIDIAEALSTLRRMQVLCALRDGPFGAQGINALIARRLGARFGVDTTHAWYHGRPVIVTRNDYARGLFNGDVGIALEGSDGLRVWFEWSDRDGNPGLRSFSPRALPAHESAWAITIHRSQGSEYRDVAVVLPPDAGSRVLNRELVYTAISRARSHAELWTADASLVAALMRPVQRQSGLGARLLHP
jgi:exodeoxyribonuclease V alpha subunit